MHARAKIGVDIDGVLANLVDAILGELKQRLGLTFQEREITEYNIQRALKIDETAFAKFWAATEATLYEECAPYPDARDALRALVSLGDVLLETSRPPTANAATEMWVQRHFGSGYQIEHYDGSDKFHVSRRFDFVIDDQRELMDARAGQGTVCLLVDRPWNQQAHPGVIRVAGLAGTSAHISRELAGRRM